MKKSSLEKLIKFSNPLDLSHLKTMTTPIGLIQHALYQKPDYRFGYSIDDSARGLIAVLEHDAVFKTKYFDELGHHYLNYLIRAKKQNGSYHNFANKSGKFIDEVGSLDSQGRTLWAFGHLYGSEVSDSLKKQAHENVSRYHFFQAPFLRSRSFALLGYLKTNQKRKISVYAHKTLKLYQENNTSSWRWYENFVTYSNAIIPLSLFRSGVYLNNLQMRESAIESFLWLDKICRINGKPAPIGCYGWYAKNHKKAEFDQQVVDAADMVLTAVEIFQYNQDQKFLEIALDWMDWFYGNNILGAKLVGANNGVYDGITPNGVNENQGAESIVMYILAYVSLARIALAQ